MAKHTTALRKRTTAQRLIGDGSQLRAPLSTDSRLFTLLYISLAHEPSKNSRPLLDDRFETSVESLTQPALLLEKK
jgi:hypothetical protein